MERDKNKSLESAIRNLDWLYEKASRFMTEKEEIELAEKIKHLQRWLGDLIW